MSIPARRIVLFYKNLICRGGAERLFVKEYQYLSLLGYEVFMITYRLEQQALFGVTITSPSLIVLRQTGIRAILELVRTLRRLGNPPLLCSSGHLDVFLASLFGGFEYALHIHQPCFMSFNDYDKYSVFLRRHFDIYTRSNFGAARFVEIRKSLSVGQRIGKNVRSLLSIGAKRRSRCNFVLSHYAQKEKRDLYGIHSLVLCGALDDDFHISMRNAGLTGRRGEASTERPFTLLTVARLDINKRIDELIRATALLVQAGKHVRLLIVGDGPEQAALSALAREIGLQDTVEFLGFVPDEGLSEIYARSHLFVSIDWADYKLTLFESLARGLPVLVSDETECDKRLLALGYVRAIPPLAGQVAQAIKSFMDNPVGVAPDLLTPILQDYTWGSYFTKIALALANAGLVARPANGPVSP